MKQGFFFLGFLLFTWMLWSLFACDPNTNGMEPKLEPTPKELLLLAPLNQGKRIPLLPTLRWQATLPQASYSVIVAKNAELKDPVLKIEGLRDTSYQLKNDLSRSTNYYWSVVAHMPDGKQFKASSVSSFRTEMAPPQPSPLIATYFVSTSGVDAPEAGSMAQPFRTLGYASQMVPPGEDDTIFLLPGTYFETEPALIGLRVNVKGAGVNAVTLSSSGVLLNNPSDAQHPNYKFWYDGALIQLVSPHLDEFRNKYSNVLAPEDGNQVLTGFRIDGQGKKLKAGIWVENRHRVYLHDLGFKDLEQRGVVVAAGDKRWYEEPKFYLKGIKIHDCVFTNCGKDLVDESLGNLNIAQLDGAEIYNINVVDNEGYGIKFIFDGYFKNTRIHDCNIEVSERDKLWNEDISLELWNLGPGNEVYNIRCNTWLSFANHPNIFGAPKSMGENLKVHHVQMLDKDGNSNKEGIEIGLPGVDFANSYIENKGFAVAIWNMGRQFIRVRNNVFYNTSEKENWTGGAAIYVDNSQPWPFSDILITNNVFDRHNIGINIKGSRIERIKIHNNAFINTRTNDVQAQGNEIIASHNIKYSANDSTWDLPGVTQQSNNYSGDPGYIYKGSRWDTYYRPYPTAFAVNKGLNVDLPFIGTAPDIGFFELQ